MTIDHRRRLHRHPLSGHAHRVELFLSILALQAELIDVDLAAGEQRTPVYLSLNPFGEVPVLEDGDTVIADSTAILVYLALRYDSSRQWYPSDPQGAAAVQKWLAVAAGPLASGPCAARLAVVFKMPINLQQAQDKAHSLFALIDAHLSNMAFLAGATPTIADVALYSYTAHAPEGGVRLEGYPALVSWLSRIEALPGFIPMIRSPCPVAA